MLVSQAYGQVGRGAINCTKKICVAFVCALFMLWQSGTLAAEPSALSLTVLGAGGPELNDGLASSGYVLWVNDKARVIVDAGTGSSLTFGDSGADFADVSAILLSHLHVDHSNDVAAYVKGSYFTARQQNLLIAGPAGNDLMPSTTQFLARLLGPEGAYRYLAEYLQADQQSDYLIVPQDVELTPKKLTQISLGQGISATALAVYHGPVAALAWRLDVDGRRVVISGDMSHGHGVFTAFAANADLLVMHNAVPEDAWRVARNLHMTPSKIGQLASGSQAKTLLLAHFMRRTQDRKGDTLAHIREHFAGEVRFAEQGQTVSLPLSSGQ